MILEDLPVSLRQPFPWKRDSANVNSRNVGLHQLLANGNWCFREFFSKTSCTEDQCPYQHVPPSREKIQLFLPLGKDGQKFIYNTVKNFLGKYPMYRHGQGPKVGLGPQVSFSRANDKRSPTT